MSKINRSKRLLRVRHQIGHTLEQSRLHGARGMAGELELPVDLPVHLGGDQRLHAHLDRRDVALGFGLRVDLQTREVRAERGLLVSDPCLSKTSPSECAGSVETSSVARPASAAISASAPAVVVLPTPPFPPTKMMRLLEEVIHGLLRYSWTVDRPLATPEIVERRMLHAHARLCHSWNLLQHESAAARVCSTWRGSGSPSSLRR